MKLLVKIILIALLVYFGELYLPWWSISIAAFLGGLFIKTKGVHALFAGFLGVAIIWLWISVRIDIETQSILTNKIAQLANSDNKYLVIAATALLGGLVGGISAWTGHNFRKLFEGRGSRGYYK